MLRVASPGALDLEGNSEMWIYARIKWTCHEMEEDCGVLANSGIEPQVVYVHGGADGKDRQFILFHDACALVSEMRRFVAGCLFSPFLDLFEKASETAVGILVQGHHLCTVLKEPRLIPSAGDVCWNTGSLPRWIVASGGIGLQGRVRRRRRRSKESTLTALRVRCALPLSWDRPVLEDG